MDYISPEAGSQGRYGGELPEGADLISSAHSTLPKNVLAFSHGRAALAWYLDRHSDIEWAMHCAYTCPTVPKFLSGRGLHLQPFDVGVSAEALAATVDSLTGRGLVLIPALFGRNPWVDMDFLARHCRDRTDIIIDAAQTAFGYEDYAASGNVAVLSCPRKACALGSGAMLKLHQLSEADVAAFAELPGAPDAARLKREARTLFETGKPDDEIRALERTVQSEEAWPAEPHRMAPDDLQMFLTIDARVHRDRRCSNAEQLKTLIESTGVEFPDAHAGSDGVPFNLPVLLPPSTDRARFMGSLSEQRVFASALWPDCEFDPMPCPLAECYRDRLIVLPVDQRFGQADINQIANSFVACRLN
jgi:hypothetical protein